MSNILFLKEVLKKIDPEFVNPGPASIILF